MLLSALERMVLSYSVMPVEFSRPEYRSGDLPNPGIKNTGMGHRSILQGIFLTQGSKPGLLHCRLDSLPAEPPGKPKNTGVGSLSLLQQIFLMQESNQGLLHCRWILDQLSYEGSPNQGSYHWKGWEDTIPNVRILGVQ